MLSKIALLITMLALAVAIHVSACAFVRPPDFDPLGEARAEMAVAVLRDVEAGTWVRLHLLTGEQHSGQLVNCGYVTTTIKYWTWSISGSSSITEKTYETKHVLDVEVLPGDPTAGLRY